MIDTIELGRRIFVCLCITVVLWHCIGRLQLSQYSFPNPGGTIIQF